MSETKATTNSTPVLAIAVVWGLVLLGGFIAYRGEDLGNLGGHLANLTKGNIFAFSGFDVNLGGVFIALLIGAAWYGLGSFKLRAIEGFFSSPEAEKGLNPALHTAYALAIGAAVWSFIWFFLGLFGAYTMTVAVLSAAAGVALAVLGYLKRPKDLSERADFDLMGQAAFFLLAFLSLITFIAAVAPPTAKDTLLYHFAVPKVFAAAGNNSVIEGNIASYLALGTEMHVVWAMLLSGIFSPKVAEPAAGATVFLFAPILLLAIYGWARDAGLDKTWSLVSALLVGSIPTFFHVASNAYIDLALALYISLAIHSVLRWQVSPGKKWMAFAAIFLGAALSVKLTAVFAVFAVILLFMLRARDAQSEEGSGDVKAILSGAMAALAGAAVLASPWYLRNWYMTGSPVFPFYMNIFKGSAPGWDAERSTLFQFINSAYGGANKGVVDYLTTPLMVSLRAQPELPEYLDGVLGVAFLFGIPFVIWAYRKYKLGPQIRSVLIVSAILFVFWLFTSQQLRYLLPVFPGLAVVIAVSLNAFSKEDKTLRRGMIAVLMVISIISGAVSLAWFARKSPLQAFFGGESRDAYLTRNIDYYPFYQTINNELPEGSKVWLINMRRDTYHINKPYFSDYMFEDWTLRKLAEESRDINELRAKAKNLGITHILARHDFLLDYKQTVLVDEKRPEKDNLAKVEMVKALLLDNKDVIRADKKFSLVAIK